MSHCRRYRQHFPVLHVTECHTADGTTSTSLYCTLQNVTLQTVAPALPCTAHYRMSHCRRYHQHFPVSTLQNVTMQTVPPALPCTAHYITSHCRRYHQHFPVLHITECHTADGTTGTFLYCTLQNVTLQTVTQALPCTAHYRMSHCRRYHQHFPVLHITECHTAYGTTSTFLYCSLHNVTLQTVSALPMYCTLHNVTLQTVSALPMYCTFLIPLF